MEPIIFSNLKATIYKELDDERTNFLTTIRPLSLDQPSFDYANAHSRNSLELSTIDFKSMSDTEFQRLLILLAHPTLINELRLPDLEKPFALDPLYNQIRIAQLEGIARDRGIPIVLPPLPSSSSLFFK